MPFEIKPPALLNSSSKLETAGPLRHRSVKQPHAPFHPHFCVWQRLQAWGRRKGTRRRKPSEILHKEPMFCQPEAPLHTFYGELLQTVRSSVGKEGKTTLKGSHIYLSKIEQEGAMEC